MTATKHKSRFRDPNKVTLSSAKWKKEVGTKPFCEGRQEFSMSDSAKLQMEDVMLKDPKRQNNQEDFQSYRSSIWGTFMAIVVVGNVDDSPPPPTKPTSERGILNKCQFPRWPNLLCASQTSWPRLLFLKISSPAALFNNKYMVLSVVLKLQTDLLIGQIYYDPFYSVKKKHNALSSI